MKFHLELESFDLDCGRKYLVHNNYYDSVTTITSSMSKDSIERWKRRIGKREAEIICKESSERGTQLHSLCENHFLNNLKGSEVFREDTLKMFDSLKPHLSNIEESYSIESCLYSDYLRSAGRSDHIGIYNGIPSVIDFKTSRKPKKREWIENYFTQLTFYAFMFKERTGFSLEQLVIMMVSLNGEVQIFREKINQSHINSVHKYINHYRSCNESNRKEN